MTKEKELEVVAEPVAEAPAPEPEKATKAKTPKAKPSIIDGFALAVSGDLQPVAFRGEMLQVPIREYGGMGAVTVEARSFANDSGLDPGMVKSRAVSAATIAADRLCEQYDAWPDFRPDRKLIVIVAVE